MAPESSPLLAGRSDAAWPRTRSPEPEHASSSDSDDDGSEDWPTSVPAAPLSRYDSILPIATEAADGSSMKRWGSLKATVRTRIRYYVPSLSWIPAYQKRDLPHDLIAGLTVAFVMIPQGLSYAFLAHLDPIIGLYTACAPVVTYAFFGTSRQLSVGPEALVSLLTGSAVAKNNSSGPFGSPAYDYHEAATIAATLSLLVGLFTIALGFFRFGFIDSMLSRALLRGFISAVALVIMIEQAPTLLGLPPELPMDNTPLLPMPPGPVIGGTPDVALPNSNMLPARPSAHISEEDDEEPSPFEKLLRLFHRIEYTHMPTLYVSLCSIAFLLGAAAIKQRFSNRIQWIRYLPEIIVLVLGAVLFSYLMCLDQQGIQILGHIEFRGFPIPQFPSLKPFSLIRALTIPAILISILGFVESIVVTKQYAGRHGYPVSRNRELVALGCTNLAGALFHAYPAYGSMARSRISDRVGARTQLAGMVGGVVVLVAMFVLLPYFAPLPKAAMASIIFVAALSLLETHDVAFIVRVKAWRDMGFLLFTFFTTLFVSIEAGILLSVALSLLLVVRDVAVPRITVLGKVKDSMSPYSSTILQQPSPGLPTPTDSALPINGNCNVPIHHYQPQPLPSPVAPSGSSGGGPRPRLASKYRPVADFPHRTEPVHEDPSGVIVVRIDEPLTFANTGELRERLGRAERFGTLAAHPGDNPPARRSPVRHIVFDVRHMPRIDASAVQILGEVVWHYRARGVHVSFVKLRPALRELFQRAGIVDLVGPKRFVSRIADAIDLPPSCSSLDLSGDPRSSEHPPDSEGNGKQNGVLVESHVPRPIPHHDPHANISSMPHSTASPIPPSVAAAAARLGHVAYSMPPSPIQPIDENLFVESEDEGDGVSARSYAAQSILPPISSAQTHVPFSESQK